MAYQTLVDIYYKAGESVWEETYQQRFHGLFAQHFPFSIGQYGYSRRHPAFYCITNEMTLLLHHILSDSLKLTGCIQQTPPVGIGQFLRSLLIAEVKSSNDIEGVRSTRREIALAMAQQKPQQYVRLWGIVNKYHKIIAGEVLPLSSCEDVRRLYDEFLWQEIHRDNPRNLPDGALFRKESVDIVSGTGKTLHRGTTSEEEIQRQMIYALEVLHSKEIPRLIGLSLFHYFFAHIHPFYDGNGRLIRFITSYYLAKEIHPTVALRLSGFIKENKKAYYDSFTLTENDKNRGDLTPFILSSLTLIHAAVTGTAAVLQHKKQEFDQYARLLEQVKAEDDLARRIYHVLLQAMIYSDGGASMDEIQHTLGIKSRKTIERRLQRIPQALLYIEKGMRPYRYRFRRDGLRHWREGGEG